MSEMVEWVELAARCNRDRNDYLSEFLNKNGVKNQVNYLEASPSEFKDALDEATSKYKVIRIGSPYLSEMPTAFEQAPLQVVTLGAGDAIFFKENRWWVRATLYRSIVRLAKELGNMDLQQPALIIGSGGSARSIIGALLRIGYTKFNITEQFDEKGQVLVESLKKTYFNIEFTHTPQAGLTMLPGIYTCVVNTTPLVESNEILGDLYYFNFLRHGGVVMDLNVHPPMTPLLTNAKEVGAQIVTGIKIATESDLEFSSFITDVSLNKKDYYDGLHNLFEKKPMPEFLQSKT